MPQRGADLHYSLTRTFEEAIRGGLHDITVTRHEQCAACVGTGRLATAERRCVRCQGAGQLRSARGHMVFAQSCASCRGTGRQADVECPSCGGQQTKIRTDTLTINLPPGLADGARIRIPQAGHAGRHGGAPGDLFVAIQVAAHPVFRREGDDLHVVVPVAIHEAALGARSDVPTLQGTARMRVPPGTQSGQRFRLRERGVPDGMEGRSGDLVVEVKLVLPRVLDERSKQLLREFGELNAGNVRKDLT